MFKIKTAHPPQSVTGATNWTYDGAMFNEAWRASNGAIFSGTAGTVTLADGRGKVAARRHGRDDESGHKIKEGHRHEEEENRIVWLFGKMVKNSNISPLKRSMMFISKPKF